jgi:hypothetical protein
MKPLPLFALFAATLFGGCTSTKTLKVSEQNGQVSLIQDQGDSVLVSQKKNAVVLRLVTPWFSEGITTLPAFFFTVGNGEGSPIDFRLGDIRISVGSREIQIFTQMDVRSKLGRQAVDQAVTRSMRSSSQSSATAAVLAASGTSGLNNDLQIAREASSAVPMAYKPDAPAAVQAKVNADLLVQMAGSKSEVTEKLRGAALIWQRKPIMPGTIAGGVVKFDALGLNKGDRIKITVSVGSERHEFLYEIGE